MQKERLIKWIAGMAAIACIMCFALLYEIHAKEPARAIVQESRKNNNNDLFNQKAIDSAIILLRSGDLVVRRGIDVSSYMFAQMNRANKTYSHCGIVMIEKGYPFVYHSIGGEDNPDERLRRDSANFFFSSKNNLAFGIARYDMTRQQVNKLRQVVAQYYKEGRKFDMAFDLATDDRLYCAEFVYKAVRAATGDSNYIKTTTFMGARFVGVDNLFLNRHARMIWQVKFK